jgi:hypothetical protein
MIGQLPKSLNIGGKEWAIRSDFRIALLIFQGLNDPNLKDYSKRYLILDALYEDYENIPRELHVEALEKASAFLDGGDNSPTNGAKENPVRLMDWEQDEQLIFSAVNKVAGMETRTIEYMHWWTFLGHFQAVGESLLTSVINIRSKKAKGKRLDKGEQQYYRENKYMIDLTQRLSDAEQAEYDYLNKLLK